MAQPLEIVEPARPRRFLVETPDGRRYQIEAPPHMSDEDVMRAVETELGQRTPKTPGDTLRLMAETGGTMLDNAARALARGASFGFADEAAAAGRATVGSLMGSEGTWRERYGQALAEERARDAAFDARNPVLSPALQMLGAASAAALPVPGPATTLGGNVLRGAATGASYGAVAGFGSGEGGPMSRLSNAAMSGLAGGAIGAAVPLTIAGAGAAAQALSSATSRGQSAADRAGQRLVLRDLARDNIAPEEVVRRLANAGDAPLTVADVAGPNVQQGAAVVARIPGESQRLARDLVAQRGGAAQAQRLRDSVRQFIQGGNYDDALENLIASRAAEAQKAYDAAYRVQMPRTLELQKWIEQPEVREGIKRGLVQAKREALATRQPFDPQDLGIRLRDDGGFDLVGGGMPTRVFDIAKRGLDEMIEATRLSNPAESRSLRLVRDAMLKEVDRLNPKFAEARQIYAGYSALKDAAELGRSVILGSQQAWDDALPLVRAMSPGEKDFFRLGVARGLVDAINRSADGAELTRLRQMAGSEFVREKLRAAFDNADDLDRFLRVLDNEMAIAATNRALTQSANSPTFHLGEKRADLARAPRDPLLGMREPADPLLPRDDSGVRGLLVRLLIGHSPQTTAVGAMQTLPAMRMPRDAVLENNAAQYARYVLTSDPIMRQRLVEALMAAGQRDLRNEQLIRALLSSALRGAGPAAPVLGGAAVEAWR